MDEDCPALHAMFDDNSPTPFFICELGEHLLTGRITDNLLMHILIYGAFFYR